MRRNFFSEDFVRVISGKVRGLKLKSPEGEETRPTLDRVKEAVFSMLLPYLSDATVLDLFAGSGALGIEALSRGSKKAFFVDRSDKAIDCIKRNVADAGFENDAFVLKDNAETFLKNTKTKFDIVFLDPPYDKDLYNKIINQIEYYDILNPNGIIIAEWDYNVGLSCENTTLKIIKEKKYGRVGITVFIKE